MAAVTAAAAFFRVASVFFRAVSVGFFARMCLLRFLEAFYLLFEKFGILNFIA
jgi:hypothetical protein